jgi:hypothetical protein
MDAMSDVEYEQMLLTQCWKLIWGEYTAALGDAVADDAVVELAKQGKLIDACEQHVFWLRKASLAWWHAQFQNGGVWQTLFNMQRCWPVAMHFTAHAMEAAGAPKHAALLRSTIALWDGTPAADQAQFLKHGALSAPHVSMRLDEHLCDFSALSSGAWGAAPGATPEEPLAAVIASLPLVPAQTDKRHGGRVARRLPVILLPISDCARNAFPVFRHPLSSCLSPM